MAIIAFRSEAKLNSYFELNYIYVWLQFLQFDL